jgi:hypothetical protein
VRVGRELDGGCEEGVPRESRGDLEGGVKEELETIPWTAIKNP